MSDFTLLPFSDQPHVGVYIIGYAEIPDLYKIGHTSDLRNRIKTLKIGMPFEPIVYHFLPCVDFMIAMDWERKLHKHLHDHHVRGEWYRLTEPMFSDVISALYIPEALSTASQQAVYEAMNKKFPVITKSARPSSKFSKLDVTQINVMTRMARGEQLIMSDSARDTMYLSKTHVYIAQVQPLIDKGYIEKSGVIYREGYAKLTRRNGKFGVRHWKHAYNIYVLTEKGREVALILIAEQEASN